MTNYTIITDSGCDIDPAKLAQWGVSLLHLKFRFDDLDRDLTNEDMPLAEFFAKMKAGGIPKTSAANPEEIRAAFEPVLAGGSDILYLCFSSGLSNTCNAAHMAASDLLARYPGRKIEIIDTLCASAGQGLAVYLAVDRKAAGASLAEAVDYLIGERLHICHWFTVDNLTYLRRGGRVSATAAFLGGVLDIKPVLHVDDDGHLINITKVRGRRSAIRALAAKYEALALDPRGGVYFISHGDCEADALALEALIYEKYQNKAALICDIGPVISAHSGPGTLALFFLGSQR